MTDHLSIQALADAFAKKDAEITRLKVFENEVNTRIWNETVLENELYKARALITELADALEEDEDFIAHQFEFSKEKIRDKFRPLIARAREAT